MMRCCSISATAMETACSSRWCRAATTVRKEPMVAITRKSKELTTNKLDTLLMKYPGTIKCPLTQPQFVELYTSGFPTPILKELKSVEESGYAVNYASFTTGPRLFIGKPQDMQSFWLVNYG